MLMLGSSEHCEADGIDATFSCFSFLIGGSSVDTFSSAFGGLAASSITFETPSSASILRLFHRLPFGADSRGVLQ